MDRPERLRRVALVCCHCLRNVAFYRAGWRGGNLLMQHQFWINANSNALDVAVLEWCKLFAEYHGKHHWRNVVLNPAAFISGLCAALNVSVDQFQNYEHRGRVFKELVLALPG